MDQIASLVSADASLSAEVLHLVNSAFFGLVSEMSDLRHATSYLGIGAIRDLAVVVELTNSFHSTNPVIGKSIDTINDHSQAVASTARDLLDTNNDKQNAFTAGLLHDVGLLALASVDTMNFEKVHAIISEGHCVGTSTDNIYEAEEIAVGASHANLGAYLLSMWGLSHRVVEAVALHHNCEGMQEETFGLAQAVHIADAISRQQVHEAASICALTERAVLKSFGVREKLSHHFENADEGTEESKDETLDEPSTN